MPACAQRRGAAPALFIPLIAAFLLFGETPDGRKLAAIALAFCALYCLLRRPSPDGEPAEGGRDSWLWPLIVWAGYGVIDVLFKQVARTGTAFSARCCWPSCWPGC